MKIRAVWHRDIKQMAGLFRTGYVKEPYAEKWSKKAALAKIRDYYRRSVIFVAVEGPEVLGFVVLDEDKWPDGIYGWFEQLVVSPKHQRNGIGNCLMERSLEYFKGRKFKGAVGVTHPDAGTWSWYGRLGFKSTELRLIRKDFCMKERER